MLGRELELVAVAIVLKETVASRLEGGGVGGTEGEGWEEVGDERGNEHLVAVFIGLGDEWGPEVGRPKKEATVQEAWHEPQVDRLH